MITVASGFNKINLGIINHAFRIIGDVEVIIFPTYNIQILMNTQ